MTPIAGTATAAWWEVEMPINQPVVHYRFLLTADDGLWSYSAAGPSLYIPLDNTDFRVLADFRAPMWVHEAVFYQIFPDRFARAPSPSEWPAVSLAEGFPPAQHYEWGEPPDAGTPFPFVFYGGDLPGIEQRLPYLAALGITALYLNPVFSSASNHRYDVTDYEHVDPRLGGDVALAALRQALTHRHMRYILDIVPNHSGLLHPWFQAACKDHSSVEAGFFTFQVHPHEYASWLGVPSLPKLNYRSAELRRRMYEGEDAVFRRWLRPPFAADGWRVDVANMLGRQGATQLGEEIVTGIRAAVKSVRADAYLLGENFFDATSQLQGNQWDAAMNYAGFAAPLWYWLAGHRKWVRNLHGYLESPVQWSTAALAMTWQNHLAAIPWAIALQQFNLLGSHDTPRIRAVVEENDALHRLAACLQFTFPGVPCIYYGDEIGMTNDPHLDSRACMVWEEERWDHNLLAFYRSLVALRRDARALQCGGFRIVAVETDTLIYQRRATSSRILIVAHRAGRPRPAQPIPIDHVDLADGTRFIEYFSRQALVVSQGTLPLPEHQQGATIWIEEPAPLPGPGP